MATVSSGIVEAYTKAFIGNEYEGSPVMEKLIGEHANNGFNSVVETVLEDKGRILALVEAREAEE